MAGDFRMILGEALGELQKLEDASFDALITDPPYSSGGQFRGDRALDTTTKYVQSGTKGLREDFAGDNRDQRSYAVWCALWLAECLRVLKPGAPAVLFTDWRQLPTISDLFQVGGLVWRGVAVWDKTEGARPQLGAFRAQAEFMVWGTNGPRDDENTAVLPGVFTHYQQRDDKHHLSGKPTPLLREVVKICKPGGRILDPFAGSGTTLVAALVEGYDAVGIERSAAYHQVAVDRCLAVLGNRQYGLAESQLGLWAAGR